MKNSKKNAPSYFVYLNSIGCTFLFVYIFWSAKEIARLSNDVDVLRNADLHENTKVI